MKARAYFSHFRPLMTHKSSSKLIVPKKYFFADTNVIIGYRMEQYQGIKEFVNDPAHKFFYTETVLDELQHKDNILPEANPANNANSPFKFVNSGLSAHHKKSTLDLLTKFWSTEFPTQGKKSSKLGFTLTPKQMLNFTKDLYIIFESSYACHAPEVVPSDDFTIPELLTNNMRLLNKFLARERAEAVLENVINLCGMEHLITAKYLEDEIDNWLMAAQQANNSFDIPLTNGKQ